MHATLLRGGASHKGSANWVVRLYYRRAVLFIVCSATETWYTTLYLLAHFEGPSIRSIVGLPMDVGVVRALFLFCTPLFAFKQVANFVQMKGACDALVEHDAKPAKKTK